MPSIFPGMDPYVENSAIWPDFHLTLNTIMRAELNQALPERYAARVDRHVWIEDSQTNTSELLGRPDVYVADPLDTGQEEATTTTLVAPTMITLPALQREDKTYLKIIDARTHRVITVFELLSPTNKTPGRDYQAYLAKRNAYLAAGVNLVEIDLLRAGQRPAGETASMDADYYVLISPTWDYPTAGLWPISLREPLPTIPIPLLGGELSVELNLQECFNRAFDEGRYLNEIDYSIAPEPPLLSEDVVWANDLIKEARS